MTGFLLSAGMMLAAAAALIGTVRQRKKLELPVCLFLIAFEIIVLLVTVWEMVIYGAVLEMVRLKKQPAHSHTDVRAFSL